MRDTLRALVSMLIVVTFAAVGLLSGFLFSLPSGGFAIAGGGHGASPGHSFAHPFGIVAVGGATGLILALAVVWGISRNHVPSQWFGALVLSGLAILLAWFIRGWHYPLLLAVGVLLVPVLCGGFLYAEARTAREHGSGAGA